MRLITVALAAIALSFSHSASPAAGLDTDNPRDRAAMMLLSNRVCGDFYPDEAIGLDVILFAMTNNLTRDQAMVLVALRSIQLEQSATADISKSSAFCKVTRKR